MILCLTYFAWPQPCLLLLIPGMGTDQKLEGRGGAKGPTVFFLKALHTEPTHPQPLFGFRIRRGYRSEGESASSA